MDAVTFAAVIVAASLHAAWNAIIKLGLDQFLSMTLLSVVSGLISLAFIPFLPLPAIEALPFLAATVCCHTGYKLFLLQAYKAGDLGQVYPLARGTAPLIVAVVGVALLSEHLAPLAWAGIAVLVGGVWLMSLRGGRDLARMERKGVMAALATSAFIAGYTLIDGTGARIAGTASGYTVWLFLFDGIAMATIAVVLRGPSAFMRMSGAWKGGAVAGALSLGAYWIAIWAMTRAPIAMVAALRETSVLFAVLISAAVLKEPLTRWRTAAALLIVGGAAALRLG
ncbi:EamA family transporter [Kaustia mangrovi]|uniref:EamA family transporter n=1 Tax=Kaustia mangrovi TaxID=2593653 RepID=A0A7S8C5U2_9HYPH|nr:EamA family transporter [Kaustia mangrovi]QPC43866.1 EamA family transporter [Kaustia mangrovi]